GLYRMVIERELAARGLPDALLWLPIVESGFTPKARSQAQAVGLWQFIMATGQRYGLKRDAWTDDRMNPDKATVAAVEHLSDLYDVLDDWLLAIAAYNCGEERVLRAINRQSTYDFWQLDLPRETEQYVPRFLAVASIIANPDQYGVSLPTPRSPSPFDERLIEKSIALADAARVLGVPPEHLKALNPSLRSDVTPPAGYRLRVPAGLGDGLLASLGAIPEAKRIPAGEPRRYKVRRGDTLSGIAQKFGTTVIALKKANRLRGNTLRVGQSLDIPGLVEEMPVAVQASTPAKPVPGARNGGKKETAEPAVQTLAPVKPAAVAVQNDSLSKPVSPVPSRSYKVRRGDTLSGIAQKFGTTVIALKQANRLKNNRLAAGRVLTIPDAGAGEPVAAVQPAFERPAPAPAVAPSAPSDSLAHGLFPTTHAVRPGDTIWSIARQYGLTVPELMDLNGLKRGAMLQRSQVLRVVPEDARTIYYTVAPGDTLYSISKAHAVPVRSLMEWNQLGSFEIKTGQRLKIVLAQ
ncbi:MAG: LysM peptidoglycan-binding domain-containing protein, partial [Candidatus Latescibacteria bacterium]|nr:LysM peptidoglycan-binding domain-containing protein [Candidatus Latescibacterota bacterium]